MALTAAERMARTRARRRGEEPPATKCSVCGKDIKNSGNGKAFRAGLCYEHWKDTEEGIQYSRDQRRLKRERLKGPIPFRYFGAQPNQENLPEGPFNRMRLAISSTYVGKGKPRGKLWIVWSDDVVTEHDDVTQKLVGTIDRNSGVVVDRSDLALIARTEDALTERIRHYGHSEIYLLNDR